MNYNKRIKSLKILNEQLKNQYSSEQNRNYCLQCKIDKLEKEKQELIEYLKERIIKCNEDKEFWLRKNELEAHDIREAERGIYEEILNKIEKR